MSATDGVTLRTIIALFDDTIDAEHALTSLRKSDQPSAGISVILRERVLDPDPTVRYETVLSRVVASSALEAVSTWLQGLASLILPDRASYLVAGPIGAVLATTKDAGPQAYPDEDILDHPNPSRQLAQALAAFGFARDESHYLEARVVAGSPMIAVTSGDAKILRDAHRIFSDFDAVHIELAQTDTIIHRTATRLLLTGPDGGGSVVVADAIAPLHRLSGEEGWNNHSIDLRGRKIVSADGDSLGTVSDVLFEYQQESDSDLRSRSAADRSAVTIRYLLVDLRGPLGLQWKRVALPAELADTHGWTVAVDATRDELRSAPRFDGLAPLSRQDEVTIRSPLRGGKLLDTSDQRTSNGSAQRLSNQNGEAGPVVCLPVFTSCFRKRLPRGCDRRIVGLAHDAQDPLPGRGTVLGEDDVAVLAHDHDRPLDTLAIRFQCAIGAGDPGVFIDQQIEVERMFPAECLVAFGGVRIYTDRFNAGTTQVFDVFSYLDQLVGTARSEVLGIKDEHGPNEASQVGEVEFLTIVIQEFEVRRLRSYLDQGHDVLRYGTASIRSSATRAWSATTGSTVIWLTMRPSTRCSSAHNI